MSYSEYERFKWEVLGHTPHRLGVGAAWYEARKLAPYDHDAQADLVRRVVLELFDDGLIFCAYASEDEGYNLKLNEFVSADRAALETEISSSIELAKAAQEPRRRRLWHRRRRQRVEPELGLLLLPTKEGFRVLDSLPAEAFLHEDVESKRQRVEREHPGFLEKQDQYFRDVEKWISTGKGKMPRLPD